MASCQLFRSRACSESLAVTFLVSRISLSHFSVHCRARAGRASTAPAASSHSASLGQATRAAVHNGGPWPATCPVHCRSQHSMQHSHRVNESQLYPIVYRMQKENTTTDRNSHVATLPDGEQYICIVISYAPCYSYIPLRVQCRHATSIGAHRRFARKAAERFTGSRPWALFAHIRDQLTMPVQYTLQVPMSSRPKTRAKVATAYSFKINHPPCTSSSWAPALSPD